MIIPTSKRLSVLIDWIDGNVLADIGCDHGYVAVNAILLDKVKKSYACDIAQGPLDNAKRTIENAHVQDVVETRLMNGIENLPSDVDTIVIAGMGSKTIIDILSSSFHVLKKGMKLYLLPHKDVNELRAYVSKEGIQIIKETVIYEDKHYYPLLECIVTLNPYALSNEELEYGYNVLPSENYTAFIDAEIEKWTNILQRVPEHKQTSIQSKLNVLNTIKKS